MRKNLYPKCARILPAMIKPSLITNKKDLVGDKPGLFGDFTKYLEV
jgi:hypothetical protein